MIVGNQCGRNAIEKFKYNGYEAIYLNFKERGVGLNRNNALMRATGDICLFADDDMAYVDGYVNKVLRAFRSYPDADVIIFNLTGNVSKRYNVKKACKINKFNYFRYGAARIAIKRKSVVEKAIYFNQCFGGGTQLWGRHVIPV